MQNLRSKIEALRAEPQKLRDIAIIVVLAAAMIVGFAQIHIPGGGDDWQAFSSAARRMVGLDPGSLYTPASRTGHYTLFNPPWLIIPLLPVLLLPHQWGWAIDCAGTLFLAILLLRKWLPQPGMLKIVLLLLSPSMFYILLHGQIDVIVLSGVLLPVDWWWLTALAKPQNTIGLALGVPVSKWLRTGLITAGVIVLTLILLGNWPQALLSQSFVATQNYNLWQGLWPFQLPIGAGLVAVGAARKDQRYLLAASPFLSPYVTLSNMIFPWLAVLVDLTDWQAAIVFAVWWGAVIYRMLGGAPM